MVICSPHSGLISGPTQLLQETLGATRTEEIIYHLELPGLQEEGGLENSKAPMVQGTPYLNIILQRALTALLSSLWIPALGHHHALGEEAPAIPTIPTSPLR